MIHDFKIMKEKKKITLNPSLTRKIKNYIYIKYNRKDIYK